MLPPIPVTHLWMQSISNGETAVPRAWTVRNYERLPGHHEAVVLWAMATTMTRRLARRRPAVQPRSVVPDQAMSAPS